MHFWHSNYKICNPCQSHCLAYCKQIIIRIRGEKSVKLPESGAWRSEKIIFALGVVLHPNSQILGHCFMGVYPGDLFLYCAYGISVIEPATNRGRRIKWPNITIFNISFFLFCTPLNSLPHVSYALRVVAVGVAWSCVLRLNSGTPLLANKSKMSALQDVVGYYRTLLPYAP